MSDSLDRSTVISGPAIVQFRGQTFYTEDDISLDLAPPTEDRSTSLYGVVDKTIVDRVATLSIKPTMITSGALAVMYPYRSALYGSGIFGATDYPIVIWTNRGQKVTLASGAVSKCPSLMLNSTKSLLGPMELTAIGKNNTSWATANSFSSVAADAWVDPGLFSLDSLLQQVFTASWAASGAFAAFNSEEGFSVDFDVKLEQKTADHCGTYNYLLTDLAVRCKAVPFPGGASPIAEAAAIDSLGIQGTGAARGKSLSRMTATHDLVITGAEASGQTPARKLVVTLSRAGLVSSGMRFGARVLRNGEYGWESTRLLTAGVPQPLYTIALS